MLKAFSKSISKSILALVKNHVRNLRRRSLQRAIHSTFQRLEPRRVLTVQGVFDAISGNLSVNITPGGNTDATLGALDANQFFLDIDGNNSFDAGELVGAKSDLKSILVTGTSDPLGNLGTFTWKDHLGSSFQLDRILASDLAKISLDLLGQISVAQDSSLHASESITLQNSVPAANPMDHFLTFEKGLNLKASGNDASIFINLDYTLTINQFASFQANQGSIYLSDIDANAIEVISRDGVFDSDITADSIDIRANQISLVSTTGSIGQPLTDILSADISTTNQGAIEIAARSPGSLVSNYIATQGTVSIHSQEFPNFVDTNQLWLASDSGINASDLSGLSTRITDLALVANPSSPTAAGILELPDLMTVSGDLRIFANEVIASDSTIDLQADRVLWNTRQAATFSITANQLDAQSQESLLIHSNGAIRVADLNNDLVGLSASGHLALESQQGSITVESLIDAIGPTNILLQTLDSGTIVLNAGIQSGTGNITLSSRDALWVESPIITSGPGTIVLESPNTITLGANSTFQTNSANLGVFSQADIRIGSVHAGTGNVFLNASGNIFKHNPSNPATNIIAESISLKSDARIGNADPTNPISNNNQNAISINATNLAAQASNSIYIQDTDTINVDRIYTNLTQVQFNSSSIDVSQTLEDLTTTANNGNVKLQTILGNITINPGSADTQGINAHGSGDILLQTLNSGSVVLHADIASNSGNIHLFSRGELNIQDRIQTSRPGTISLVSEAKITVEQLTTNNVDLSVVSTREIVIGTIDAGTGSVAINSARSITDADGINATTNVIASKLLIRSSSTIGNSDLGSSNPTVNRNAFTTQVDTLAALATSGIYIQEKDGLSIDAVSVSVNRLGFNSTSSVLTTELEDLTTRTNGPILIQSLQGDIVVNPGLSGTAGIHANGSGNILLETRNSGTIITNANILSGTGNITLSSKDNLVIDQRLSTSGPGTIYLHSQSDLFLNQLDTNDTDLGARALGNIFLGNVHAATASVLLQADKDIANQPSIVGPVDVIASKLTMIAGGKIGDQDTSNSAENNANAIVTRVDSLAARSANGTYIQEIDGLTIESISNPLQQVNFRGGSSSLNQVLEDLTTTSNGPIKLQSLSEDILVHPGTIQTNGITANGTGDVLLQALDGNIYTLARIASSSGHITLSASEAIDVTTLQTAGSGTIYLSSGSQITQQAIVTEGGDIQILSGGNITLGTITSGSGAVYLQATGDIQDPDSSSNATNITANALAMKATGKIGGSDLSSNDPNVNRNAIGTKVSVLAAESADGIYVQEADSIAIDTVTATTQEVHFNSTRSVSSVSLEDLTTSAGGAIKLQSIAGDIVVHAGTSGTNGITATGTGDVLLESLGGDITAWAPIENSLGSMTIAATGQVALGTSVHTSGDLSISSGRSSRIDSIRTSGGNLQILSGDDLSIGTIDAGIGQVFLQASGNITDSDVNSNSPNIIASGLAMKATGMIGDSDLDSPTANTNRNAIRTHVDVLAAESSGGIYIQETDAVVIDQMSMVTDRVNFNSTRTTQSQELQDLSTTGNGPVKLQSLSGNIVVNPGTPASSGINASGSGDILLQTLDSGTIVLNAGIQSGTGNITLSSRDALWVESPIITSGPGTIVLESPNTITLGANSTFQTNSANLGVFSQADIRIGSVHAGTGNVFLNASGNIFKHNPSNPATNIIAESISLKSDARIGNADPTNPISNNNQNAISINATNLAAQASNSIYIQDTDTINVDRIYTNLTQVQFNSSSIDVSQTLEDLTTTANNGNVKLQTILGNITINPGSADTQGINAHGSGDILLQTLNSGSVVLHADIASNSGNIHLFSRGELNIQDRIQTSRPGTISLVSEAKITVEQLTTNNVDLSVVSTREIVIGTIDAGTGSVAINSARSITDADGINATTNVIASKLLIRSSSTIGNSDLGSSNPTVNRNAFTTQVDTLAALATSGIYIQEKDGLSIDAVSVSVNRLGFNSTSSVLTTELEDLTTRTNGPILIQSLQGDIVVNPGLSGTAGIHANGSGNILLETRNSGTIITNANILSGTGNITLSSKDNLVIDQRLSTSGPGTIYLHSQSDLFLNQLDTNDTDLGARALGNIFLGNVHAATASVLLQADKDIANQPSIVGPVDVIASKLTMIAGGKIGDQDTSNSAENNANAIVTRVDSLAARSANGTYIQEIDGLTIESISNPLQQVNFRGGSSSLNQVLEDLTTTSNGPIKLQSLSEDILVHPGTIQTNGITANGTGDVLLQALDGNIYTLARIASSSGHITLSASEAIDVTTLQTAGSGTIYLSSGSQITQQAIVTEGGDIQILSGGNITLGTITSGSGAVYLQATGDIQDPDSSSNATNITANALAMKATGKIGGSDLSSNDPNVNRNAIGTKVSVLAAESADGIYVQEADSIAIDTVTATTQEVHFNSTRSVSSVSLEDLTTSAGGAIKLQSIAGDIVVHAGTSGTNGITATGTGDILLQTVNAGTIVINADVQSGSGHISLNSRESLTVVDRLRTSSPGTIYLASGSEIQIDSLITGTNVQMAAGTNLHLGRIDAGSGIVFLQAGGDILDTDAVSNSTNILADALAMIAGGKIGDSDPTAPTNQVNRNAIGVQVTKLAAQSANGMYIQEADGLQIGDLSISTNQVFFNSTRGTQSQSLEGLTTTSSGPIKLQSLTGDIAVHSGTFGTNGVTAGGSGDILLESLGGDITISGPIESGTGNITLVSHGQLNLDASMNTSGTGSIYLESGENMLIESISSTSQNLHVVSGKDVFLGEIDASRGRIYLQVSGDIRTANPGTDSTNIHADSLALIASGRIGDADTGSVSSYFNGNAIGTSVRILAAQSAEGIYIREVDGLTVDSIEVASERVHFNSSRTSQLQVLEDLTTTIDGPIKLQSIGGDIIVNAGSADTDGISANGAGDILLETIDSGSISTNALVHSATGHITLNAQESLNVVDKLQTGGDGTIYLNSSEDLSLNHLESSSSIVVIALGDIYLGNLDANTGVVYLEANHNIIATTRTVDTAHVSASAVAMMAGSNIGNSDLSNGPDDNTNAIVTKVHTMAAHSGKGMYIQEIDGVIVDQVSLDVKRVNFNSTLTDAAYTLEDLTTTNGGPIKLQSVSGDIGIKAGTAGTVGVLAHGSGDVLLQTLRSGTVDLQAEVRSETGDITINSFDILEIQDHLRTEGQGKLYLTSQSDILLHSLNTGHTHLAVVSDRNIELGVVASQTAGVYLQAGMDILDMDPDSDSVNVSANALTMVAGNKIGDSDLASDVDVNRHAIATRVDQLAARSSNGIYVRESDGLTVDAVSIASSKVHFNSSKEDVIHAVEDLTTTVEGPIKLQSIAGDILINAGSNSPIGILSAATGDVLLQTIDSGTVTLNGLIQSESGDVSIESKDALVIDDRIRMGGLSKLGTIFLASEQQITIHVLKTNHSNLWVQSGADMILGSIEAGLGRVYLDAKQDILDGVSGQVVNVSSQSALAMRAGSEIGPISTQVDVLSAVAADGIAITEFDDVTVGASTVEVSQVHFNSSETQRVAVLEELTTTGSSSIRLVSLSGDILLKGDVVSQSGNISIGALGSVLLGGNIRTDSDVVLESLRGAITELDGQARVESELLVLRSATFAHLHDVSISRLNAVTLGNAVLSPWQEVNLQASSQGDDFVDALDTISQSTKDELRAHFRYADRYQDVGYSLYLVNGKELTVETAIAGRLDVDPLLSDRPGVYLETRLGDLVVQDAIVSNSSTDRAGAVVIVSDSKVLLNHGATLQSNYIGSGEAQLQLINDVDLKARVFDALEKPNPAGGFFTTRIVSRNDFSESSLPEIPTSPGPTKRLLQGVASHYGSANESGFDLFIGYADGKLESFARQGAIYLRDGLNDAPVESRPQALGSVGYLERSVPFDVDFLNSTQELPTDVVIRRSDDFFIFQKQQPIGLDNFNPPNNPAATSSGFYDLTVQTHRIPDVISEGSDSGLPMPPSPDTAIPTFREPEPYTLTETIHVITESAEYEDPPYEERKSQILIKRLVVNIVREVEGDLKEQGSEKTSPETEDVSVPAGLLGQTDQLSLADVRRIEEYLKLQPGTRQGKYEVILRTSDGTEQLIGSFTITADPLPEETEDQETKSESDSEKNEKPSNPTDQSLYLNPKNPAQQITRDLRSGDSSDQAWSLVLGSLWLARKPNHPAENSEVDFSIQARRLRRIHSELRNRVKP